jgi:hypothetical protein
MHSCKYPNHLSEVGYYRKILGQYKNDLEAHMSEHERKVFLTFVLQRVEIVIEGSEEYLDQVLNSLLRVKALSQTECTSIPDVQVTDEIQYTFHALLMPFRDPEWVFRLVESHFKIKLNRELDSEYINFLQWITERCIQDLVKSNRPSLQRPSKKVSFTDKVLASAQSVISADVSPQRSTL